MEDSEKVPEFKEHQLDHYDKNAKMGTSDNSFNSGRELGDESALDYDPSSDH